MYEFGRKSLECLESCEKDLKILFNEVIKTSPIDFAIHSGYRSPEEQKELYLQGKSKKDGYKNLSKHNYHPSKAIDIHISNGYTWDEGHLIFLAGFIIATAQRLKEEGKINHSIRWGGNWDMDGIIIKDQKFQDLVHFELI